MEQFREILSQYLPPAAVEPVHELIGAHKVQLIITRHRKTKLGDFRPGVNGRPARISLNHSLNPYAFLLTFLHELAHHLVWVKHKRRATPHGKEWKKTLQQLRRPFLSTAFFPKDILDLLQNEDARIFAASTADTALARKLKNYDKAPAGQFLETLPENAHFSLPDGRQFKKLSKRRKNYLCFCLTNKRNYIFNPLAEVYPVNQPIKEVF
jgi:SprT protein